MFSITFQFGPQQAPWTLLYKEAAGMTNALALLDSGHPTELATIGDDFGQLLRVRKNEVHALLAEDMTMSAMAMIERSMHMAKVQAKLQVRASTDPEIKAAQRPQGTPIFSPMGNGRMS